MTNTAWTDERVAELRQRWAEGQSAGYISRQVGMTRNTVMGKRTRLKLPARPTAIDMFGAEVKPKKVRSAKTTKPRAMVKTSALTGGILPGPSAPPAPVVSQGEPPLVYHIGTLDLEPNMCRWIDGDPKGDHSYCGKPTGGRSYCATHIPRVYTSWAPE
jgi:hypothetical protein